MAVMGLAPCATVPTGSSQTLYVTDFFDERGVIPTFSAKTNDGDMEVASKGFPRCHRTVA